LNNRRSFADIIAGVLIYQSALLFAVCCVSVLVGVPGNILSAVVWFRTNITATNSSAIYLGALAIVDLVALLLILVFEIITDDLRVGYLSIYIYQISAMLYYLDAAFVLAVSVERVIFYRFPSLVS